MNAVKINFRKYLFVATALCVVALSWTALRRQPSFCEALPVSGAETEFQALRDAPAPKDDFDGTNGGMDVGDILQQAKERQLPAPQAASVPVPGNSAGNPVDIQPVSSPARWFPDYSSTDCPPQGSIGATSEETIEFVPEKLPLAPRAYKGYTQNHIRVPTSKLADVRALVSSIESMQSYAEAIEVFRRYLQATGLIQRFETLRLRHQSPIAPDVILKNGLMSYLEQVDSGLADPNPSSIRTDGVPMHISALGDGIYFYGAADAAGWDADHYVDYGGFSYEVTLPNIGLLLIRHNDQTGGMLSLYFAIRRFWGKPEESCEPLNLEDGMMCVPPFLFSDLKIDGLEEYGEIFLKRRIIEPEHISYTGHRDRTHR